MSHVRSSVSVLTGLMSLILATSILMTGCRTQDVPCHWTTMPIGIDGKAADWADMPVTYFEEEGAALGIGNDSNHLYINLRTRDATQARLVRMTGLTVYLDAEGGKSKDFFIRFRGGPALPEMPFRQGRGNDGSHENKRRGMSQPFTDMPADTINRFTCFQKGNIVEKPIPTSGSEGPAAACDTSMSFYNYEFSIPLWKSVVRYYGLDVKPGQTISVGLVWGDIGNLRGESGPRGGMGGIRAGTGARGGKGGGRGGGPPPGIQQPEKQEVWVRTQLAVPPTEPSE